MEMANHWRTKEQIMDAYGYSASTFYARCDECWANPDYRDAIIHDGGQKTFVDEDRFQDFLRYRSDNYRKQRLDPHLRK